MEETHFKVGRVKYSDNMVAFFIVLSYLFTQHFLDSV